MFFRYLRLSAILALLAPAAAHAQSAIVLWPTDPTIGSADQATALWLENHGDEVVTLQVRAQGWDQSGGTDALSATQAIVSSPPIAQVGPGQRQLVRIIRRTPAVAGEQAYRLLIDELPRPATEAENGLSARLAVQMRYSLPLFTYGDNRAALAPRLMSTIRLIDGRRWIEISNIGNRHARLTDLRFRDGQAERPVHAGLLGYVLPGATMRWVLPEDVVASTPLTVTVNGTVTVLTTAA